MTQCNSESSPLPTTRPEEDLKPTAVQPLLYIFHFSSVQQGRKETPRTPKAHHRRRAARPAAQSDRTVPSPAPGVAESGGSAATVGDSPFFPTPTSGQGKRRCPGSAPPGGRGLMPERGTAFQQELLGEDERREGKAPPQLPPGVTVIPPLPRAFHAWSAVTPRGAIPRPLASWGEKQNKLRFIGFWCLSPC